MWFQGFDICSQTWFGAKNICTVGSGVVSGVWYSCPNVVWSVCGNTPWSTESSVLRAGAVSFACVHRGLVVCMLSSCVRPWSIDRLSVGGKWCVVCWQGREFGWRCAGIATEASQRSRLKNPLQSPRCTMLMYVAIILASSGHACSPQDWTYIAESYCVACHWLTDLLIGWLIFFRTYRRRDLWSDTRRVKEKTSPIIMTTVLVL